MSEAEGILAGAISESGLAPPGTRGVVMLSGGADSCALALGLSRVCTASALVALHLNYGLREDSGVDEAAAAALCERLDIELVVARPDRGPGNVQAWARDERYLAAEDLRAERGLDWIAVAHTMSDLAETVLYRLVTSPGTRALAAMPARRGIVVRPLLSLTRSQVREAAIAAGLPFVDDRSNEDPTFARARIRHQLLPLLEGLNPAAVEAIAATRDELAEELEFIGLAARELLGGARELPVGTLEAVPAALRRHVLRLLAERELDRLVPLGREQAERICRLADTPEGGSVDLGGGDSFVVESGIVAVRGSGDSTPDDAASSGSVVLELPGNASWHGWKLSATELKPPFEPEGPEVATLDADLLGGRLEVRGRREGDRISPLGLGGSKSLQDLFTDAGLRRSLRRVHPVLTAAGEIAWVPGLAVGDRFRLTPDTRRAIRITARREPVAAQGGRGVSVESA